MTVPQLNKLKKKLPRGYAKIISAQTGFSVNMVYMVITGLRSNESIINALLELAKTAKEKEIELKQKIKAL